MFLKIFLLFTLTCTMLPAQPYYISSISYDQENLNDEQQERYLKLTQSNFFEELRFASLEPLEAVNTAGKVQVYVEGLECPFLEYTIKHIEYADQENYSFYGWVFETDSTVLCQTGEIRITCLNGEVTGNISLETESFTLFDLTGGLYVLGNSGTQEMKCGVVDIAQSQGLTQGGTVSLNSSQSSSTGCGWCYIDVLVVYTPLAWQNDPNPNLTAQALIDEANTAHKNSHNNSPEVKFKLAGVDTIAFNTSIFLKSDDFLDSLQNSNRAKTLRNNYSADIVFCITGNIFPGVGGSAYNYHDPPTPPAASHAFGWTDLMRVKDRKAGTHELGHTLGANHQKNAPLSSNPPPDYNDFPYHKTYFKNIFGRDKSIATVMWAGEVPDLGTRILYYSNPAVYYKNFHLGDAGVHENALVTRNGACTVANFRSSPGQVQLDILADSKACLGTAAFFQSCRYNIPSQSTTYTWETSINGIAWNYAASGPGANIFISQPPGAIQHVRLTVQNGGNTYYAYHSVQVTVNGYNSVACPKSSVAYNENEPAQLSISPNPVASILFIKGDLSSREYTIFNSMGQHLGSGLIDGSGSIDLSGLPSGPYLIQIGDKREKFLKL